VKTDETKRLEHSIWKATCKMGVFGCMEVTIGWFGKERVDYMTYDTNGIFRCYEIKVTKSDFKSKAHNTFVGHFNYYVLTEDLYKQVKEDIPDHIGVYVDSICRKRAKRQPLTVDEKILKDSLIRSLHREAEKIYKSNNVSLIEQKNQRINRLEKELVEANRRYFELLGRGVVNE
jgi:hypothetical protein